MHIIIELFSGIKRREEMKKALTLIIIGLLCLSTFSIFAPQMKGEGIHTDFESGFGGWQPFTHVGAMDTFIVQLSTTYAHSGTYSVEQFGQSSGSESFGCEGGIRLPVTSILDQYELNTWVYVTERSDADASSLFGFAFGNEFVSWNPWGSGSSYVYARLSEGYQTKGDWYNPVPYGLTLNTWHQVKIMVYTNLGTISIWLDGSLIVDNWPAFNAGEKPDYYYIECSANYYGAYVMHQYIDDAYTSEVGRTPVGYWKFDEGSGNIAHDSSGNGNDGTIYKSTWVDGKVSKALGFNGIDSYVSVPDSSSLDIAGNQICVVFWVKFDNPIDGASPYMKFYDKGNAYNSAMRETGSIRFTFWVAGDSSANLDSSRTSWLAGMWYHIAEVYDGNVMSIYVNGALDNSTPITGNMASTTYPIALGAYTLGGQWFLEGAMDEFKIHNYARTAEEILSDYASARPQTPRMFATPNPKTMKLESSPAQPYPRYNFSIMVENSPQLTIMVCNLRWNTTAVNITAFYHGAIEQLGFSVWVYGNWEPANGILEDLTTETLGGYVDIVAPVEVFRIEVECRALTPKAGTVIDISKQEAYDYYNIQLLSGDCPYDHTLYVKLSSAVGGVQIPVDKLSLLTPSIGIATTALAAAAATSVYVKRKRK
jgi:hypothetical protein